MTREEELKKKYQEINWEVGILEADWFSIGVYWADEHTKSDLFTKDQVIELIKDYFGADAISEPDLSLYIGAVIEQREFSK